MRVLITGGAGFIGSHLVQELVERKHQVIVIDDLSTGRIENIRHLEKRKNFSFYKGSILNKKLMQRLVRQSNLIYHLAAAVGVKYVLDHPLKSLQINVRGTELLLDLAVEAGGIKVVLASSSEVYGKIEKRPFKEDDDCLLGPTSITRWGYACSKAMDEFLALAYFREKCLPVVIVRFFNICGPRQSAEYGMVIPRFISQALKGEALTVYGDGRQTRSFLYVKDALESMINLAGNPQAVGEIVNLGSPWPITIKDLARKIITLTKSRSAIKYISYKEAYPRGFEETRHRLPDIRKAKKLIGFHPRMNLEKMLKLMIEMVRDTFSKIKA